MRKFPTLFALLFSVVVLVLSCQRDQIDFSSAATDLRFNRDTVFCDTVYHQMRSETYAFKVYNKEDKDVTIPNIRLEKADRSLYRINVDGKSGYEFTNVPLRRKDSLYVFVEIAPTSNGPEHVAVDRVVFSLAGGTRAVTLFSVVQDAEYFFQKDPKVPNVLSGNVMWNNTKAKIIVGELTLAQGSKLTVQPGTRIYMVKNSGIRLATGATMEINGDLGAEVTIRGDRNDPAYDTIPKNWNSILAENGSQITMNYAKIFGGTRGLDLRQASATINNTIIHTFDEYGVHAVGATVQAKNLVMNNSRLANFAIFRGGSYDITHATMPNFWRGAAAPSLTATNEWKAANGQTENGSLQLAIKNSILYTPTGNAVIFKPVAGQTFGYLMQNCMISYQPTGAGYVLDNNPSIQNAIPAANPKFKNTSIGKLDLRLNTDSPAKSKGNTAVAATVPLDLLKIARTVNPSLGAYQ